MLAVGAVISGIAGVMVVGAALGVRYVLRSRPELCEAVTVGTSAGGLILAGAVLSQNPWRSVDGYAGHSAGVQLLACLGRALAPRWSANVNPPRFDRNPASHVGDRVAPAP